MRFTSFAIAACAAWTFSILPAQGAWNSYISHPLGFSFAVPGALTAQRGTYEADVAGKRDALIFTTTEDGIDYKITVVDMVAEQNKAANLLGEASYNFQDGKKLLMDSLGRADRHFGRKLTIDVPGDGGRSTAEFYFINGRLLEMQATVKAGGDYASPDIAQFIDSVGFFSDMASASSIELALPQ